MGTGLAQTSTDSDDDIVIVGLAQTEDRPDRSRGIRAAQTDTEWYVGLAQTEDRPDRSRGIRAAQTNTEWYVGLAQTENDTDYGFYP